ncbi:copper resistance CopC family protein [Methylobacillus glycogenes]|uniref:copper resistance CopC family protein n=1 Tax=Methylobacillus glycogenes TaxID=406 RepID=UPI0009DE17BB|nr:copper resistance CopC family protein [Methylobacillus glycogenes]
MKLINTLGCLLLLGFSSLSWGHSKLTQAQPANGSTLAQVPPVIVLNFNKPIENKFHQAELQQGQQWLKLKTEASEKTLQIWLEGVRPYAAKDKAANSHTPATMRIRWRVISRDGHSQSGQLQYQLQP